MNPTAEESSDQIGRVADTETNGNSPVLTVEGLCVSFPQRRQFPWRRPGTFTAVEHVDLHVAQGETLGLVGESGSGKTTTGRAILGLVPRSAGRIFVDSNELTEMAGKVPRTYRRAIQAVFQDPFGSLNPRLVVRDIIGEPLRIHFGMSGTGRSTRVRELLALVGLPDDAGNRYPYEFSGGQRQRIVLAKALAVEPRIILLDEPVSVLDVSIQSQVISLLEDIQAEMGVSYLFIAHDLAVVRHASHRIAVMYRGRIVEEGPADLVCENPAHPYTQSLLESAPDPNPRLQAAKRSRRMATTAPVTAIESSVGGCSYAPRCPHAMAVCSERVPPSQRTEQGAVVECHLYGSDRVSTGTPVHVDWTVRRG